MRGSYNYFTCNNTKHLLCSRYFADKAGIWLPRIQNIKHLCQPFYIIQQISSIANVLKATHAKRSYVVFVQLVDVRHQAPVASVIFSLLTWSSKLEFVVFACWSSLWHFLSSIQLQLFQVLLGFIFLYLLNLKFEFNLIPQTLIFFVNLYSAYNSN